MPSTTKSAVNGSYPAHRERQRARILNAARELFDVRGIDRVTVAEIVAGAGLRASTLYEYFSNKDEIVWALVEETISLGYGVVPTALVTGSGLARITALLQAFEDELIRYPERVRFMAQFDAMYARDWSVERLLELEDRIAPDRSAALAALIREGIQDGSLRSDLDPELTLHAVLNTAIGAQRRLASLGHRVEEEFGQPIARLFHESVRILLLGLRATE